jgi:hypothetical protein
LNRRPPTHARWRLSACKLIRCAPVTPSRVQVYNLKLHTDLMQHSKSLEVQPAPLLSSPPQLNQAQQNALDLAGARSGVLCAACGNVHTAHLHTSYLHTAHLHTSYFHTAHLHTSYFHTAHLHTSYFHTAHLHTSYFHTAHLLTSYFHTAHLHTVTSAALTTF